MNNLLEKDVKYLDEQYRIGEGVISDNAFKKLEKLFIPVDPELDYFHQKNNKHIFHRFMLIFLKFLRESTFLSSLTMFNKYFYLLNINFSHTKGKV